MTIIIRKREGRGRRIQFEWKKDKDNHINHIKNKAQMLKP